MSPTISVIFPVFNAAAFLKEAVESVLSQTFRDFELIAIDDGSTDDSAHIIKSFGDNRIRLVEHASNRGLIATLNYGTQLARGEYIARMDADDISLPHRFAAQVAFLKEHPEVAVCGTWFRTFGLHDRIHKHPLRHEDILEGLLHVGCVIGHPTVMFRRAALTGLQYEPAFEHAEDYRLWARMSLTSRFANLPSVCLLYRTHGAQVSERRAVMQRLAAQRIQAFLAATAVPDLALDELRTLERTLTGEGGFNETELRTVGDLLLRLVKGNATTRRFHHRRYKKFVARAWMRACLQHSLNRHTGFRVYLTAPRPLLRAWPTVLGMAGRALFRKVARRAERWAAKRSPLASVVVRVSGDLANQMFQYATAFAVAERSGSQVTIDTSDFNLFRRHRYQLSGWSLSARHLKGAIEERSGQYELLHERQRVVDLPLPASGRAKYLIGEWRDVKRFSMYREALLGQFHPAARMTKERLAVAEDLRANASVAVLMSPAEFMVGPVANRAAWMPAATADFYAQAIAKILESEAQPQFRLFMTQRGTFAAPCIERFRGVAPIDIDDQSPDDLHMISHAKHFIIPSSSFGWWAAWLGSTAGKTVIAPRRWRILIRTETQLPFPPEWQLL